MQVLDQRPHDLAQPGVGRFLEAAQHLLRDLIGGVVGVDRCIGGAGGGAGGCDVWGCDAGGRVHRGVSCWKSTARCSRASAGLSRYLAIFIEPVWGRLATSTM